MHIDKRIQQIRSRLLANKDPYELYNDGPAIGSEEELSGVEDTFYNLGEVMEEIQQLLDADYLFNSNPLMHLRKYFLEFNWQSHPSPTKKYKDIIRRADYVWRVRCDGIGGGFSKYVTATERGSTGYRRICYSSKRFESDPMLPWSMDPNWVAETEALILVPTDNEITILGSVNGEIRELKREWSQNGGVHEAKDILASRGILTFRRTAFAEKSA